MACAFMLAAMRHEAETYFAQGLHQEAIAVYDRLLLNSDELHPSVKTKIHRAINRIQSAAIERNMDEEELLCEVDIRRIKKGWACQASVNDLTVSAEALIDLGRFESALEEYRSLLMRGRRIHAAIKGAAKCLVQLIGSDRFGNAVDLFAKGLFQRPQNRVALKLQIAKHIDPHQYPRHFSALYKNLTEEHPVAPALKSKIIALGKQLRVTNEDAYGPTAGLNEMCGHLSPHRPAENRAFLTTAIDKL